MMKMRGPCLGSGLRGRAKKPRSFARLGRRGCPPLRGRENGRRFELLPFRLRWGLIVVGVVVRRRRWWHRQRGGHVEGVAGNRAAARVAADFGIGEEGFVSVGIDRGDGNIKAVAGPETE